MPSARPGLNVPQEAARTRWGIAFIGFGLGMAAAWMLLALAFQSFPQQWLPPQSGAAFIAAAGLPILNLYPGLFGGPHVRRVRWGFALAVAAVVVGTSLWLLGPSRSELNVSASALRVQLLGGTLFVLLGTVAVYLAIEQLATPAMRRVALVALAAAFVVQIVAYLVVSRAIDTDIPLGAIGWDTPPLSDVQRTWGFWGALNAIPFVLFLAAYESTYWRLRRGYAPSRPPAHT